MASFSIWRRLKEDYHEEEIFSLTLLSLLAAVLVAKTLGVVTASPSGFSLAGAFWGTVLAIKWYVLEIKKDVWEVFDSLALPLFGFLFWGGVGLFLTNGRWQDLFLLAAGVLGRPVFNYLQSHYRSFSWYKSGKIGFLFWASSFLFFLTVFGVAFDRKNHLYWESSLWLLTSAASAAILYYRSGRNYKEDIGGIFKWRK